MARILLVNQGLIPHYRIRIYDYLRRYLRDCGFDLLVAANGVQANEPFLNPCEYIRVRLSALSIGRLLLQEKIDIVISWVDMKNLYLFPTYFVAKTLLRRRMIYWGQGRDLLDKEALVKNIAYAAELAICDAIILYAGHLVKYVPPRCREKVFIANNTLCPDEVASRPTRRVDVLARYGIRTAKNIICIGRIQRRKRVENLLRAHVAMRRPDIGLIIVGPDPEGLLHEAEGDNVYKLGPIYGREKTDLLCAADVCCLPGAVGLSIIDAFQNGLPFVTEEGDESAEIMYLKDGKNGFVVAKDDIDALANRLLLLVDNDDVRKEFARNAQEEIAENGSMNGLCSGFKNAIEYVLSLGT